jgi:8-oxo-dGTP pyrophosphatase MutT (NUDIX family)
MIDDIINNTITNLMSLINLNECYKKGNNDLDNDNIMSCNETIKTRVFECALCNSKTHSITKCFKYRELKKNLEKKSYIKFNTKELNANDEIGFCASGVIPYIRVENKIYLLVLIETREKKPGLNFIGGKRECVKTNNTNDSIRPETSYETALNELKEELGEILTIETTDIITDQITKSEIPNFVFWSGDSKMCLYGIKLPSDLLFSLTLNDNDKSNTEAQGFKWIGYNGLGYMEKKKSNTYKFHKYSKSMFDSMKKLSSNNDLNNLFI